MNRRRGLAIIMAIMMLFQLITPAFAVADENVAATDETTGIVNTESPASAPNDDASNSDQTDPVSEDDLVIVDETEEAQTEEADLSDSAIPDITLEKTAVPEKEAVTTIFEADNSNLVFQNASDALQEKANEIIEKLINIESVRTWFSEDAQSKINAILEEKCEYNVNEVHPVTVTGSGSANVTASFATPFSAENKVALLIYRVADDSLSLLACIEPKINQDGSLTVNNWSWTGDLIVLTVTNSDAIASDPVYADGYYVVGTMNDWKPVAAYKMMENPANTSEQVLFGVKLDAQAKLKARKVENGGESNYWYPSEMDNVYVVSETGYYDIYLRPDGSGDSAWHWGYLFVQPASREILYDSEMTNGIVTGADSAVIGDVVTLTVDNVATGYELRTLTVKEGENVIATTPVENEEGKYTFTMPSNNVTVTAEFGLIPVAKIGETKYETLQAAVDTAAEGDTIVMIADTKLTATVNIAKSITLDLNGKTIDGLGLKEVLYISDGLFTMDDSSEGQVGVIQGGEYVGGESTTLRLINNGSADLKGGTVLSQSSTSSPQTRAHAVQGDGKDVTLNGATIHTIAPDGSNSYCFYGKTLIVNSGLILHEENTHYAITNFDGGKIIVNGGTIRSNSIALFDGMYGEGIEINGGDIYSKGRMFAWWRDNDELTITGGKLTSDVDLFDSWSAQHTNASISGGYFSNSVPENLCAEGYVPSEAITDGEYAGMYTVLKQSSITIAEGIENGTVISDKEKALTGETITLTVTPADSYDLDTLTVFAGETEVETTQVENEEGKYTFTMPAADVTVSATFKELAPKAYAAIDSTGTVLTFYYDDQYKTREGAYDVDLETKVIAYYDTSLWFSTHSTIQKVVFDETFKDARPVSTANWFVQMTELTEIEHLDYLNTSEVTTMEYMFAYCKSLTTLDVSTFDTSKVTNMGYMFGRVPPGEYAGGCSSLTSLDLSNFDTSNVTNMRGMFSECQSLRYLDVSSFDTSKVTDMYAMFGTSYYTNIHDGTFGYPGCDSLEELDLTSFNMSSIQNTGCMFARSTKLKTIYVNDSWNVQNVAESARMFYDCPALVGGAGTAFDANHIDKDYAIIDGGTDNPGYLTQGVFYTITVRDAQNGTVTASKQQAMAGKTITLTFTPEEGYELERVTVQEPVIGHNARYTIDQFGPRKTTEFVMPACNVTVYVIFREKGAPVADGYYLVASEWDHYAMTDANRLVKPDGEDDYVLEGVTLPYRMSVVEVKDGNIVKDFPENGDWIVGAAYPNPVDVYFNPEVVPAWQNAQPAFDGNLFIDDAAFVAKLVPADDATNVTYFRTLQEAITAANDGDTIVMIADYNTIQDFTIDKEIILDLNGKTIFGEQDTEHGNRFGFVTIQGTEEKAAKLIIVDSSENNTGVLSRGEGRGYTILVQGPYARAEFNGGLISTLVGPTVGIYDHASVIVDGSSMYSEHGQTLSIISGSSVIMKSGFIKSETTTPIFSAVNVLGNEGEDYPSFELQGGTIEATLTPAITVSYGQAKIKNGKVVGGVSGGVDQADVFTRDDADVQISGGYFRQPVLQENCAEGYVPSEAITDGEYAGMYTVVRGVIVTFETDGGEPVPEKQVFAKGGKATEPTETPIKAEFVFDEWVDENGDPFDFETELTEDIVLTAKWNAAVAKISRGEGESAVTSYYATLQDAVAAAVNGDTIVMIADIYTEESVVITNKTLTLDLNGKRLEGHNDDTEGIYDDGTHDWMFIIVEGDYYSTTSKLIIEDSSEDQTGYITSSGDNLGGCTIKVGTRELPSASVELKGGTITNDRRGWVIYEWGFCSESIIAGAYIFTNNSPTTVFVANGNSHLTMTSGTIYNGFSSFEYSNPTALVLESDSYFVMNGGTVESAFGIGLWSNVSPEIRIYNGVIKGANAAVHVGMWDWARTDEYKDKYVQPVLIEGGVFIANDGNDIFDINSYTIPEDITVTDGYFSKSVPPEYVVEGKLCTTTLTKTVEGVEGDFYYIVNAIEATLNPGEGAFADETTSKMILVPEGEKVEDAVAYTDDFVPAKEGHTFTGWTPDEAVTAESNSRTAEFEINKHTLTVYTYIQSPDDIPVDPSELYTTYENVPFGTTIAGNTDYLPENPTRENYLFVKWQTIDGNAVPATMPDEDLTIVGVWTGKTINVIFFSGVPGELGILGMKTFEYGKAVDIRAAADELGLIEEKIAELKTAKETSEGKKFVLGEGDAMWTPILPNVKSFATRDMVYSLNWIEVHTVKFMEGESILKSVDVVDGKKVAEPTAEEVERTGYTFDGWFIKVGTAEVAYDFDAKVTDDLAITGKWTINQYNVTFVNDDGTELSSKDYDYGTPASAIEVPDDPTKPATEEKSFQFSGWNPAIHDVGTEDETYTATYTETDNVAKIVTAEETKYFASLQNAIDAANKDDTVILLKDIQQTETVNITKTVTLDLNGNTIDGLRLERVIVVSDGLFTLDDSSEEQTGKILGGSHVGTFSAGGNSAYTLWVKNSASADLKAGTILTRTLENNNGNRGFALYTSESAKVELNGAKLQSDALRGNNSFTVYLNAPNGGSFIMNSGSIIQNEPNSDAILLFGGAFEMNGGEIRSTDTALFFGHDSHGATINGGSMYAEQNVFTWWCDTEKDVLTITGGVFTSDNHIFQENEYYRPTQVNVSGGYYAEPVPADYCAEGYIPSPMITEGEYAGMYTVVNAVTVTFDSDGGDPAPEAQVIAIGGKAEEPEEPTRGTDTFLGWFAPDAEESFDFETAIEQDLTLTAKWEEKIGSATYSYSLTLSDSIDMNFKVKNLAEGTDPKDYTIEYTFNGVTKKQALENMDINSVVVASCYAMQMTDDVHVVVRYKETVIKDVIKTVRGYCEEVIALYKDSSSEKYQKLVELCKATLDYGTYAQKQFNYNADSDETLANRGTDKTDVAAVVIPESQNVMEGNCTGIIGSRFAMTTSSKITLSVRFVHTADANMEDYKFFLTVNDGEETEVTAVEDNGRYLVAISNIATHDLGNTYKVRVEHSDETTYSLTTSPVTYMYKAATAGVQTNLNKALYQYYVDAKAFFAFN